jgi:hypothetical protein
LLQLSCGKNTIPNNVGKQLSLQAWFIIS